MTNDYPRLCGGTFFTLLLQAIKQRTKARQHIAGERDNLSETDMLVGLIQVFNPDYIGPTSSTIGTFKTNTSDFKSCKISNSVYLPMEDTEAFNERVMNDYAAPLQEMRIFVDRFIDVETCSEKDMRLVKALLELIYSDQSIPDEQVFYVCNDGSCMTKATLRNVTEVFLPSFLLGIWHFVLVSRKDNTVGKATYDKWCPSNNHSVRKYIGNLGAGITQTINLTIHSVSNADVDDELVIDGEAEHLLKQNETCAIVNTTKEIQNSLVDVFEDALDIYNIAAFIDTDFTAMPLYLDDVCMVDEFIAVLRHTLRDFRRNQDSTYSYVISFINTLEKYSAYMGMRMMYNGGETVNWYTPHIDWSEVQKDTLNYRRQLNNLYGLISNGGTLSVF